MSGSQAVVTVPGTFYVIDVSDPQNPGIVSSLHTSGNAKNVFVSGLYAYIASSESGLQIVNISDLQIPSIVGLVETPKDLSSAIDLVDTADIIGFGSRVLNISDPRNPVIVGSIDYQIGVCDDMFFSGSYIYAACDTCGLKVIDISDPQNPAIVGSVDTPVRAKAVYVLDSYAYVVTVGGGLQVIDISDPQHPTIIGSVETNGWASDVWVDGSYAYVADHGDIYVINISNPREPFIVSSVSISNWGMGAGLYKFGSYLYVADDDGLSIVDVSNPRLPILPIVASIDISYEDVSHFKDYRVYIADSYAYVSAGINEMWVIDVSMFSSTLNVYYFDSDGDGYGDPNIFIKSVSRPSGYIGNNKDCDDSDSTIHPGATEIRGDGIDQDCNGKDLASLTTYYLDNDGDGYGNPNISIESVSRPSGYIGRSGDCDDSDSSIHPKAPEVWNGIDDDCNGIIDDNAAPNKATLKEPSGNTGETKPTLTWKKEPGAIWYKLLIWNSSSEKIHSEWYDSSVVCSDGICSVTLKNDLAYDDYQWWVKSWNDYGSSWSDGMNFSILENYFPPSKVTHISPLGTIQNTTPKFTWNADPVSTWYKLWIGYPIDQKIFAKWYEASEICSGDECSVTPDLDLLPDDYEWYIKSWNEYGKVWSDGMGLTIPK